MKTFLLTVSVCLLLSTTVFAQKDTLNREKKTPEQRAHQMTQAFSKRLSLSEEQKSKIYDIHFQHVKKMEEIRKNRDKSERGNMKQMTEEMNTRLSEVLTDQQRTEWEALKKQQQERMEERKAKAPKREKTEIKN